MKINADALIKNRLTAGTYIPYRKTVPAGTIDACPPKADPAFLMMNRGVPIPMTIESCLKVITGNISELFERLERLNLSKRIIFFVRTQSFQDPNALTRRKRLWGSSDFSWILKDYKKTKDSEKTDNTGKYYIGFAEIQNGNLFEALNYSRLSSRAVVLFTNDIEADDSLLEFTDKMIDSKREMLNWSEVIDFFCIKNNIILKVYGGFDDREVSVDFFMDKILLDLFNNLRFFHKSGEFTAK